MAMYVIYMSVLCSTLFHIGLCLWDESSGGDKLGARIRVFDWKTFPCHIGVGAPGW